MFGYLGAILSSSDYLGIGQNYTFTFEKQGFFSSVFVFDSDTDIQRGLQERMANYGSIVSLRRPLFSDRWIVVVTPSVLVTLENWISSFETSFADMGYSIGFIQAEGGVVSTRPGGTLEVITEAGEDILTPLGQTAASAIKPLFPYILGAIGIYAVIMVLPRLAVKRRG
jgi:hypothetical protein